MLPTRRSLDALARFEHASDIVAVARDASDLPSATQPRTIADDNGARLLLPGDPGYDDAGPLPAMQAAERGRGNG